jgi:predicted nucleic acid-binding protein
MLRPFSSFCSTPKRERESRVASVREVRPCTPLIFLTSRCFQVLRRYARSRALDDERAAEALIDLRELPIERYPHGVLAERVWQLRHALTAYDAVYVALAEALDAALVTCDAKLSRTTGHEATITLIR